MHLVKHDDEKRWSKQHAQTSLEFGTNIKSKRPTHNFWSDIWIVDDILRNVSHDERKHVSGNNGNWWQYGETFFYGITFWTRSTPTQCSTSPIPHQQNRVERTKFSRSNPPLTHDIPQIAGQQLAQRRASTTAATMDGSERACSAKPTSSTTTPTAHAMRSNNYTTGWWVWQWCGKRFQTWKTKLPNINSADST